MRLFAQKSAELNLLCNIFKHTYSALLFRQFIGLCGSTERTTRLYYEIIVDLYVKDIGQGFILPQIWIFKKM